MKKMRIFLFISWITFISCDDIYNVTDDGGVGRRFDGIGGLSGGGPGFGASLQVLKVEIGGDDQSTDGTEASHMHEEWDQNYNRGYEWWLMEQAKLINPKIKLWGLSWAWPHWLGDPNSENSPYYDNNKTAMYTINWILGAKKYHNLTIDYIGIWNERFCDFNYILTLRKALNQNSITKNVQIVGCDTSFYDDWDRMQSNQTVFDAVYAFGVHYPGTTSPQNAIDSNKILWSSEDYSTYNDDIGAGCWARILNQNYVNGYMTSTISWNLIASYYLGLPYQEDGLMTAVQPFSGYYEVKNPIWITAHTTQFTEIGWTYLKHGCGVGLLSGGGSYVTLISPDKKDFTLIIETMTSDHSACIRPYLYPYDVAKQTATFNFGGSLRKLQPIYIWQTNLKFDNTNSTVFKMTKVLNDSNTITLDLDLDSVYTVTTIQTGNHGYYSDIPASSSFPLPYVDNFQNYNENQEPDYLTPQVGSWEIVTDTDNKKIARQTVLYRPVTWCQENLYPLALIGDISWTDLNITATLRIPEVNGTNSIFVALQVQTTNCDLYDAKGLFFWLDQAANTYLITTDITASNVLTSGSLANCMMKRNEWYTLTLIMKGNSLSATINGISTVTSYTVPSSFLQNGFAAIGSGSFGYSDINFLSISLPTVENAKNVV